MASIGGGEIFMPVRAKLCNNALRSRSLGDVLLGLSGTRYNVLIVRLRYHGDKLVRQSAMLLRHGLYKAQVL